MTEYLKNKLSEKRYNHCVRTAEMAKRLCDRYNVDYKAVDAALLHDIGKELSLEEMIEIIGVENLSEFEGTISKNILHGYAGAMICEKELGIKDKEILSAIKYHTIAKKEMSIIEKIVYISDAIEEGREYENVERLRELAFISLDKCILEELDYKLKNLIDRRIKIHKNAIEFRNTLLED